MTKHNHEFHGLWWHLGQLGRQDIHLHSCSGGCLYELVGKGRTCKGKKTLHVVKRLTSDSKWSDRKNEGQKL